jgi:hypothetical protein
MVVKKLVNILGISNFVLSYWMFELKIQLPNKAAFLIELKSGIVEKDM